MTIAEAEKLGYKIVAASPFEVGLLKNGKGIRTWWCQDFGCQLPPLDHPKIQKAIQTVEEEERFWTAELEKAKSNLDKPKA